jgi:hypothetical protein
MNITTITADRPTCFGVCCPLHGRCARYDAVNDSQENFRIAMCGNGDGEHPLFIELTDKEAL